MIEPDFASEKPLAGFIAQFCPHAAKWVLFGNLERLAGVNALTDTALNDQADQLDVSQLFKLCKSHPHSILPVAR